MSLKYTFHSTCYKKELLNKAINLLKSNAVKFDVVEKNNLLFPIEDQNCDFEADIYVADNQISIANNLLSPLFPDI
ncbi:MAG: hypothetical protein JW717_03890 [Marinilabiliaceae bacterium]|nr:hypothetical protein [Marinilabiliaceae bacterium]